MSNKTSQTEKLISRRKLLKLGLVSVAGISLAGYLSNAEQDDVTALNPTPTCSDDDDPTPSQTAGPFYTPNTPERNSLLEEGIEGAKLLVIGKVLNTACEPIGGALLDFWHADAQGAYDNVGYRLRGHQFADSEGNYKLETIMPGLYPGRTRHIHVRVQKSFGQVLTTQVYFPNESLNDRDGIFNPNLLMDVSDGENNSKLAYFNFVLA